MVLFRQHCRFVISLISIFCVECILATGIGSCPKIPYMKNFNLTKFSGSWYEIEKTFYLWEIVTSCVGTDLVEKQKGQLEVEISSKGRWYDPCSRSGRFSISQGFVVPSKKDPSVLIYKVPIKYAKFMSKYLSGAAGTYQIVSTDYTRYAIVYSCINYFHIVHVDLIWVWGREREMDAELRAKIYQILHNNHLDSDRLTLADNKNCTIDS